MKLLKTWTNSIGSFFGVSMARISDIELQDKLYNYADLSDMDLSDKKLGLVIRDRFSITNTWFNGANLKRIDFGKHWLSKCELIKADLTQAVFPLSNNITSCTFEGAVCLDVVFKSNSFDRCNFRNADLRHAEFHNCTIKRVDFRGAKLLGTKFSGCHFEHCVFDPCWKLENGFLRKV